MMDPTITIITAGLLLAALTVWLVRRLSPAGPVDQPQLFADPSALPMQLLVPEVDLATRIGGVISDGMDRVDAMRQFGADRFLTLMPMPDGTCWSLTVIHYPDEASAKASHQPTPMVTH